MARSHTLSDTVDQSCTSHSSRAQVVTCMHDRWLWGPREVLCRARLNVGTRDRWSVGAAVSY